MVVMATVNPSAFLTVNRQFGWIEPSPFLYYILIQFLVMPRVAEAILPGVHLFSSGITMPDDNNRPLDEALPRTNLEHGYDALTMARFWDSGERSITP